MPILVTTKKMMNLWSKRIYLASQLIQERITSIIQSKLKTRPGPRTPCSNWKATLKKLIARSETSKNIANRKRPEEPEKEEIKSRKLKIKQRLKD